MSSFRRLQVFPPKWRGENSYTLVRVSLSRASCISGACVFCAPYQWSAHVVNAVTHCLKSSKCGPRTGKTVDSGQWLHLLVLQTSHGNNKKETFLENETMLCVENFGEEAAVSQDIWGSLRRWGGGSREHVGKKEKAKALTPGGARWPPEAKTRCEVAEELHGMWIIPHSKGV